MSQATLRDRLKASGGGKSDKTEKAADAEEDPASPSSRRSEKDAASAALSPRRPTLIDKLRGPKSAVKGEASDERPSSEPDTSGAGASAEPANSMVSPRRTNLFDKWRGTNTKPPADSALDDSGPASPKVMQQSLVQLQHFLAFPLRRFGIWGFFCF